MYDKADQVKTYYTYLYDLNGNLIEKRRFSVNRDEEFEADYTWSYEFDEYLSPFSPITYIPEPGRYTNANNVIRSVTVRDQYDPSLADHTILSNTELIGRRKELTIRR